MDAFLHLLYLLAGQALHALARAYEADKATPDRSVSFGEVVWQGPERWRTMMLVAVAVVVAFTDSAASLMAAGGIIADGTGMALLLVTAGYNLDSISKKIFALGKPKG